jgi:hypothetical protein
METMGKDGSAGLIGSELRRDRDRELVALVGRHGVMAIEQVMAAMGVGRTATYRRAAALIEAGLLERLDLLRSLPSLLRATRDGLRYAGLGMPVAKVSAGAVDHWVRCTTVAIEAARKYAPAAVLTEREIISLEVIEGRRVASVSVGHSRGHERFHRADVAVLREERNVLFEVELTPKAPRRLEHLIRAWRWETSAGRDAEVHYLCEPGRTRRAVERAVANVKATEFIVIGEAPSRNG